MALIRHGDRSDNYDWKALNIRVEKIKDPPLTPLGITQSIETGIFLQEYLNQKEISHVQIISSPYLRSMQTASESARIFGIDHISIDFLASERQCPKFYTHSPIDNLLLFESGA